MLNLIVQMRQQAFETLNEDGWHVTRANRGANGVVYHARHDDGRDYAVKLTRRDARDRAGREFAALTALHDRDGLTPPPAAVYREVPQLPDTSVVVMGWIEGTPFVPSDTVNGYRRILARLADAHRVTPADGVVSITNAVTCVMGPGDVLADIEQRYARLPMPHPLIGSLIRHARRQVPGAWQRSPPVGLIQCDAGIHNTLDSGGRLTLVDWENSGWADPAFDVADMLVKPPPGSTLTDDERAVLAEEHAARLEDADLPRRVRVYQQLMVLWWALRFTLYLEAPDKRLVGVAPASPEYLAAMQARFLVWAEGVWGG